MSKRHYSWRRFYRRKKSYSGNIEIITESSDLKIDDDYKPYMMIAEKGPIKIDK